MDIQTKQIELNKQKQLVLVYKELPKKRQKTLKSQLEIRKEQLLGILPEITIRSSHILCESGWSFNNVNDLLKKIPKSYHLHYFVINPTLDRLHQNYLKRHPDSKKRIDRKSDWVNMDNKVFKSRKMDEFIHNLDKRKVRTTRTIFLNEEVNNKLNEVEKVLNNALEPTLFIIVGPNASGKSTLLNELLCKYTQHNYNL